MVTERLRAMMDGRGRLSVGPGSWLVWSVAAYVFLAPNVDFAPELSWHDGQRLAQIAVLALVAVGVLVPKSGRPILELWTVLPRWSRLGLGAALMLGLASSALALFPRWALLEWSLLVMVGALALAVAAAWRVPCAGRDQCMIITFYAMALAYSVKTVTIYLTMLVVGPEYSLGFTVEELFTGFSNVRFFGHVQTMLLPFLLLPAIWWGSTSARRALLFIVPALWWMLVIASGTRGSWVALLMGAAVAVFFGGKSGQHWLRWQLRGLLCGLIGYLLFIILVPQWLGRPALFMHRVADIISLRGRDVLWSLSWDLIEQHPWLGIGPMHFASHINDVAAHPHNAVIQLMVEWGVVAALLITLVFAAAGLAWALYVRRMTADVDPDRQSMLLVALLAAITGAVAQAMVDGIIVMPVSQTLLALLCGWALGVYFSEARTGQEVLCRSGPAVRGAVLIAVVGVTLGIMPELGNLAERTQAHLLMQPEGPNHRLLPRFWIQGWIGG